jgi:hypothetical protein
VKNLSQFHFEHQESHIKWPGFEWRSMRCEGRDQPDGPVPGLEMLTHWGRLGSFKLFKRPFPGFLTILTL